ncbi:uncharacterized protein LOC111118171 isoform X1 [Crassostrea virginica]
MNMEIYIFVFLLILSILKTDANGFPRVTQSTVESMNEAGYGIDGSLTTYARTSNKAGQFWEITFNQSYDISFVFLRIRGANANMMFHLFIDGEGVSNDTLCAEFSFNNTVINEAYIECHKPIRGNQLTLRRDGEIRLFEFRPIACDRGEIFYIISNTSVKCSENFFTVTRTDENESVGYKCPICQLQILPKLCKEPGFGKCRGFDNLYTTQSSLNEVNAVSRETMNTSDFPRVTQSTVESMNEAGYGIDGNLTTYARTSNKAGQYWKINFNQSYDISFVFLRIRGASANKMFHLFNDGEGEGVSNDTLCAEFSFNNTVINEAYIECHKPMRGNKLTLRRDGEIRLFEFRPIVCDRDALLDIISNTSVKCSEDALSVTGTNKTEKYECPICQLQILPNLCKEPRFEKCKSLSTLNRGLNEENDDRQETMDAQNSLWTTVIICFGSLGGFIMVLVPIIVLKCRAKQIYENQNYDSVIHEEIHSEQTNFQLEEEDVIYSNIASSRIPVETFIHQVTRKKVYDSFLEDFQSLSNNMDLNSANVLNFNENKGEDYTRLMFNSTESSKIDYVNASFIDGFSKGNAYIAAQGPSSTDTMIDFWELIWQNNCTRIVALTSDVENEKNTSIYWPPAVEEIGSFIITTDKQDIYKYYTIRQLTVTKKGDNEKRNMKINHFHITSWQRRHIPECLDSLLCLRNLVKSGLSDTDGPVLVHCSTDFGQTGTYIGLDYLIEEGLELGNIDIKACVSQLRKQRSSFIETCEEYMFLQEALVQYFANRRSTSKNS